jgi:hypothetical protein
MPCVLRLAALDAIPGHGDVGKVVGAGNGGQWGDYLTGWKNLIDHLIPNQILPSAVD